MKELRTTLLELEEKIWRALSADAETAQKSLDAVLDEEAQMLFPGGFRLSGKKAVLDSLEAQPWKGFALLDPKVVRLSGEAALLTYRVKAERQGQEPLDALVTSLYRSRGKDLKLLLHQQTPV
jgi:hypothetical protein